MARYVEDYVPVIKEDGYVSQKNITTSGNISGADIIAEGDIKFTSDEVVMSYVPTTNTVTFTDGTLSASITLS